MLHWTAIDGQHHCGCAIEDSVFGHHELPGARRLRDGRGRRQQGVDGLDVLLEDSLDSRHPPGWSGPTLGPASMVARHRCLGRKLATAWSTATVADFMCDGGLRAGMVPTIFRECP